MVSHVSIHPMRLLNIRSMSSLLGCVSPSGTMDMMKNCRCLNSIKPSRVSIVMVNSGCRSYGRGKDNLVFKVISTPYMCEPAGETEILSRFSCIAPDDTEADLFGGTGKRIAELKSAKDNEATVALGNMICAIPAKTRLGSITTMSICWCRTR